MWKQSKQLKSLSASAVVWYCFLTRSESCTVGNKKGKHANPKHPHSLNEPFTSSDCRSAKHHTKQTFSFLKLFKLFVFIYFSPLLYCEPTPRFCMSKPTQFVSGLILIANVDWPVGQGGVTTEGNDGGNTDELRSSVDISLLFCVFACERAFLNKVWQGTLLMLHWQCFSLVHQTAHTLFEDRLFSFELP